MTLSGDLTWAQAHGSALLTAAGALLIAVVVVAVILAARRASLASALRGIAIPLVLLWEAQGVYGVALRLHAPHELAYAFAGVISAVVLALASFAHGHFERTEKLDPGNGRLGPNGRRMWYVAVFMGAVVAANAGSLTGVGLRILLPLLSLVLFQAPYLPDEPAGKKDREAKEGSWRITPRRLGVSLGLLDPADTDLTTVHAERLIRQLTRHSAGYHQGGRLKGWHARRLAKLALMADDLMIAAAAERVQRSHWVLALTAPEPISGGPEIVLEAASGSSQLPLEDKPERRSEDDFEDGPETRPERRSQDRPGPSLKLPASKSSKMTPEQLALHVAAMLEKYGDKAVTLTKVKADLHIGAPKAAEALLIAKRDRVTPIGSRRSAGE